MSQSDAYEVMAGSIATLGVGVTIFIWLIAIVMSILTIIGMWKLFAKADEPAWAAIIPYYNTYIWCKITLGSGIWFLGFLIPGVNMILMYILCWKTATVFGGGIAGKLCMIFFSPFALMYYGCGSAQYEGPSPLFGA